MTHTKCNGWFVYVSFLGCIPGAEGGVREIGEKEREGGGERAPAIRAPIGSILRSLAAAKFLLVNQTIGGVGRHSVLLFGDRRGHNGYVIESFSRF